MAAGQEVSNGPISTVTAAAVDVLDAVSSGKGYSYLVIVNTGTVAGMFLLADAVERYLPAGYETPPIPCGGPERKSFVNGAVQIKRIGANNMSGVYAWRV